MPTSEQSTQGKGTGQAPEKCPPIPCPAAPSLFMQCGLREFELAMNLSKTLGVDRTSAHEWFVEFLVRYVASSCRSIMHDHCPDPARTAPRHPIPSQPQTTAWGSEPGGLGSLREACKYISLYCLWSLRTTLRSTDS